MGDAADRVAISSVKARMRRTLGEMDHLIVKAQQELIQMRRLREQMFGEVERPERAGLAPRTDGSD